MTSLKFFEPDEKEALKTKLKRHLPDNSDSFRDMLLAVLTVGIQFVQDHFSPITPQEEANALTALAFRNDNCLEEIHTGERTLDEATMRELMTESAALVKEWLLMRDALSEEKKSPLYRAIVHSYNAMYTKDWIK